MVGMHFKVAACRPKPAHGEGPIGSPADCLIPWGILYGEQKASAFLVETFLDLRDSCFVFISTANPRPKLICLHLLPLLPCL